MNTEQIVEEELGPHPVEAAPFTLQFPKDEQKRIKRIKGQIMRQVARAVKQKKDVAKRIKKKKAKAKMLKARRN